MKTIFAVMALALFIIVPAILAQEQTMTGTLNFSLLLKTQPITAVEEEIMGSLMLRGAWLISLNNGTDAVGNVTLKLALANATYGEYLLDIYNNGKPAGGLKLSVTNASIPDSPNSKNITLLALTLVEHTDIQSWTLNEDDTISQAFENLLNNQSADIGGILAIVELADFDDNGNIVYNAIAQGISGKLAIDAAVDAAMPDIPVVTNQFYGKVLAANGTPMRGGTVTAVAETGTRETVVASTGEYAIVISGPLGSRLFFSYNNIPVKETALGGLAEVRLDLVLPPQPPSQNYADSDKDGVPNDQDKCPGSNSTVVDAYGCTCEQLKCENRQLGCILLAKRPYCMATCSDGFKNQGETGIDCGGPCAPCRVLTCDTPDVCLDSQPKYCDADKKTINNCAMCGCPDGFDCEATGECTQTIDVSGLKCYTDKYKYGKGLDCTTLGPTWHDVGDVSQFFSVSVRGFAKPLNKKIRKKIEGEIRSYRVCIDTVDMGCVMPDVKCRGEDVFDEYVSTVQAILQNEVNSAVKKSLPSILRYIGTKVKIKVDLSSLSGSSIRIPYSCTPLTITPDTTCKPLIENGPIGDKADMVFVGDGFFDENDLRLAVQKSLDYDGVNEGTDDEGLFSREPLKSNKEKFNIWMIPAYNSIQHVESPDKYFEGLRPDIADVHYFANRCPQRDYIVVLSKNPYRSFCGFGAKSSPCMVSLSGESYPGRLVAHELGHGIGGLEDEYYFYRAELDDPGSVEEFDVLGNTGPNCKQTRQEAEDAWGAISVPDGFLGYFQGCGGDCGKTCESFIRPTYNSVMRQQDETCTGQTCIQGPPFDPWHEVNEQEIQKQLSAFI